MIEISGIYNNKNLYVQNPFAPNGVGFSVTEVLVNNKVTADKTHSSAFEIDLKACGFRLGDAVTVRIHHVDGSKPKVLNPEVLKSKSTYDLVHIQVVA